MGCHNNGGETSLPIYDVHGRNNWILHQKSSGISPDATTTLRNKYFQAPKVFRSPLWWQAWIALSKQLLAPDCKLLMNRNRQPWKLHWSTETSNILASRPLGAQTDYAYVCLQKATLLSFSSVTLHWSSLFVPGDLHHNNFFSHLLLPVLSRTDPWILSGPHSPAQHQQKLPTAVSWEREVCESGVSEKACTAKLPATDTSPSITRFNSQFPGSGSWRWELQQVGKNSDAKGGMDFFCTQYYITVHCLCSRSKQQNTVISLITPVETGDAQAHFSRAPLTSTG